jgi:hydroxyacylglutathione hydrolase
MLTVKTFTFNPVQENTYLLYNERGECCIIDPGCYFQEEREKLQSAITSLSLKPVLLLNTHGHLDHVFGNKFIFQTWGLIPHIHEKEQPVLDQVSASAERWGLPFDHYDGDYQFIPEDQPVFIGEERLEVLFTPGHSPGSLSFYYEPGGFIIGGDVLFDRSVGRTDLPGGDPATLLNSIQTKFFTLPDDTKVYAGHGSVTTTGFEKMNNPFVKMF